MERFLSQDRRGEGDKGEGAARGFGARDKVERKRGTFAIDVSYRLKITILIILSFFFLFICLYVYTLFVLLTEKWDSKNMYINMYINIYHTCLYLFYLSCCYDVSLRIICNYTQPLSSMKLITQLFKTQRQFL